MNRMTRLGGCAALVAATMAAVVGMSVVPAGAAPDDAAQARQATAAYHNSYVITNDSDWFQLYDLSQITCIDDPMGGMGIHFVNGSRVGDPTEKASEPEAVIYEPMKNGKLRLVGLEYVVLKSDWVKANGPTKKPSLFGHEFKFVPEGNRYGLPDFYEIHAWIWKHNPSGMNSDWNPAVSCQYA